jgi:hypothetical protein
LASWGPSIRALRHNGGMWRSRCGDPTPLHTLITWIYVNLATRPHAPGGWPGWPAFSRSSTSRDLEMAKDNIDIALLQLYSHVSLARGHRRTDELTSFNRNDCPPRHLTACSKVHSISFRSVAHSSVPILILQDGLDHATSCMAVTLPLFSTLSRQMLGRRTGTAWTFCFVLNATTTR